MQQNLGRVVGSKWYTGTGITGTDTTPTVFSGSGVTYALLNDLYLNTTTGAVYQCDLKGSPAVAKWKFICNITGPTPELVNNLRSTDTTKALTANQGKVLNDKLLSSGIYPKSVDLDLETAVYMVDITIQNTDGTITFTSADDSGTYAFTKRGTADTYTITVDIDSSIGFTTTGAILTNIAFTNNIYAIELKDSNADTILEETFNAWKEIKKSLEQVKPSGVITDGELTLNQAKIQKEIDGTKKQVYPITHAKAVWYDIDNDQTVADVIEGLLKPHLIISAESGGVVTLIKGSKNILAAETSTGIYECDVTEYGDWTMRGVFDGTTKLKTISVNIVQEYEVSFYTGSTATPTDSVDLLLKCADIYDSEITTISELIADETTLSTVIASNNAMDYMVRSTSWVSNICASSVAMAYIGLNNYAANVLISDETWLNGICSSTYIEDVLNVKVPVMTSNTTPSGIASDSAEDANAYIPFVNNNSILQYRYHSGTNYTLWLQYEFPQNILLKYIKIYLYGIAKSGANKIQAYNENISQWVDLTDTFGTEDISYFKLHNNNNKYTKYRVYTTFAGQEEYGGYRGFQMWGRVDV